MKCKVCGEIIDVHLQDDSIRKKIRKNYKFEVDDVK
jgi:Fe2+ or Zn2+ uptake regulation protein